MTESSVRKAINRDYFESEGFPFSVFLFIRSKRTRQDVTDSTNI